MLVTARVRTRTLALLSMPDFENNFLTIERAEAYAELMRRHEAEACLPLGDVIVSSAIRRESSYPFSINSIELTQTIELYPQEFEPLEQDTDE